MSDKLKHRIYLDIFQPSALRIGMSLFSVTDKLSERFDKWCNRLDNEISRENQISPMPYLLVPILEGMVYHEDDTPIQEMFYNLLKKSMDKTQEDLCHPAFPKILSQLSVDELILLWHFSGRKPEYVLSPRFFLMSHDQMGRRNIKKQEFLSNLEKDFNINLYCEHLRSLNLVDFHNDIYGHYENAILTQFGKQFLKVCLNEKTEKLIKEKAPK